MIQHLFLPARKVMDRFTFPAKFFLVSMLFAVPLTMTSVQTVIDSNHQLQVINFKHQGTQTLTVFLNIITVLEKMRDSSVSTRLNDNEFVENQFNQAKQKAINEIDSFISANYASGNQLIRLGIARLKNAVQNLSLSTGSEADLDDTVFSKINLIVKSAYLIQSQIANSAGLLGSNDSLANNLVTIFITEIQNPMEVAGEARAYGLSMLAGQLSSSFRINLINNTLFKLKDSEEQLNNRFSVLLSTYPSINHSSAIDPVAISALGDIFIQMDEQLLLDPELSTPVEVFWQEITSSTERLNNLRYQIITFLTRYYADNAREKTLKRSQYAIGFGILMSIFVYLFIGFYLAVKDSLQRLSNAALRVSEGSLDESLTLNTKDELNELAHLFDQMRIQLKEREQQLIELAITDALTGIRNRKYFNDKLKEAITLCRRTDHPISLLLIDIDHFKHINDNYGHPAGDECLKLTAETLKYSLSRPDDIIARYGGEEFALLLPATELSGAEIIAEKVREAVQALTIQTEYGDIHLTISIGVSCSSHISDCNEEKLVKIADSALYEAKASGRNKWVSAHV